MKVTRLIHVVLDLQEAPGWRLLTIDFLPQRSARPA